MTASHHVSTRMSAAERRDSILEAAVAEFAVHGMYGTSTEVIAQRAGVSQPYLFRLFGTKKDLFLAAVERGFDRVLSAWQEAVRAAPGGVPALEAMGNAYIAMLSNRSALLLQLHAYAASSDEDVQVVVRRRFAELYGFAERVTGAPEEVIRQFFAHGMLLTVAAALDLEELSAREDWARRCLGIVPGMEVTDVR